MSAGPGGNSESPHGGAARRSVFYAWELGNNLGHVGTFLPLACALRARGHAVHCAVAQPANAARLLAGDGFTWLQAPVVPELSAKGPPVSYSDILSRFGYADADTLFGLVTAWRELMRLTGAGIVLADHAPTAILAARTLGVPVMNYSTGFAVPPAQTPTPNMRPWSAVPAARLQTVEMQVLETANAVLAGFGAQPLASVAALFEVAERSLLGFPELDHYADRGTARYWCHMPGAGVGVVPQWPAAPGKRVFAYLRPECRYADGILQALASSAHSAIVYFPGAPAALIAGLNSPRIVFSGQLVDLGRAAAEADIGISYAGASTATAFLRAGKPVLLLPVHLEQFMFARRVEQLGAGLLVNPELPADDLPLRLARVIEEPVFSSNARAFAAKYAAFAPEAVTAALVSRIETLAVPVAPTE